MSVKLSYICIRAYRMARSVSYVFIHVCALHVHVHRFIDFVHTYRTWLQSCTYVMTEHRAQRTVYWLHHGYRTHTSIGTVCADAQNVPHVFYNPCTYVPRPCFRVRWYCAYVITAMYVCLLPYVSHIPCMHVQKMYAAQIVRAERMYASPRMQRICLRIAAIVCVYGSIVPVFHCPRMHVSVMHLLYECIDRPCVTSTYVCTRYLSIHARTYAACIISYICIAPRTQYHHQ
jgi:hypothetical protein